MNIPASPLTRDRIQHAALIVQTALHNAGVTALDSDFRCGQIDFAVQQLLVLQSHAHAQRAINDAKGKHG